MMIQIITIVVTVFLASEFQCRNAIMREIKYNEMSAKYIFFLHDPFGPLPYRCFSRNSYITYLDSLQSTFIMVWTNYAFLSLGMRENVWTPILSFHVLKKKSVLYVVGALLQESVLIAFELSVEITQYNENKNHINDYL